MEEAYRILERELEAIVERARANGVSEEQLQEYDARRLTLLLANASPEVITKAKAEYIKRFGTSPEVMKALDTALEVKGALEV